ncbi:MAG: SH3 domain-containing protein [Christensenellaceae bacterium]|nr:SH3 domain-containing protein [Christensenellaceae bacterium]
MKRFSLLLLTLLALVCLSRASADGAAMTIDGLDADRVHLRSAPSTDAPSLGLYFTGTEVECLTDPSMPWVQVNIGAESGYIKSDYLTAGQVTPRTPFGTVTSSGRVNLRQSPSLQAALIGSFDPGTVVTILGETVTNWYYVSSGSQTGYVMARYVELGQPAATTTVGRTSVRLDPADSIFSSVLVTGCSVLIYPTDDCAAICEYDPNAFTLDVSVARGEHIIALEGKADTSPALLYLPRNHYQRISLYATNGSAWLSGGFNTVLGVYGTNSQVDATLSGGFSGELYLSLMDSECIVSLSETLTDYAVTIDSLQDSSVLANAAGMPACPPDAASYACAVGSGAAPISVTHLSGSYLEFLTVAAKFTGEP